MTETRYDRPIRISLVSYLLFSIAALQIIRVVLVEFFPNPAIGAMPMTAPVLINDLAHAAVFSACGYFLLKGANWARIAYFVLCALSIAVLLIFQFHADSNVEIGVAIFKLVGMGGLLVTPRANRYFAGIIRIGPTPNARRPRKG